MTATADAILFWIAAFFFILASVYLVIRIRKEILPVLYPISVYLGSIAVFFILMGVMTLYPNKVLLFLAASSVMYGSAYIARFPLKLIVPQKSNEKFVFYFLIVIALILLVYNFIVNPDSLMRIAHTYAFLIAGVFTIGYTLFMGITTPDPVAKAKGLGSGISLGLCCVVAHGLVAFQLLPLIAIPLFGVFNLELPLLFAISSPIAFIFVLIAGRLMTKRNVKEERIPLKVIKNNKRGKKSG